MALSPIQRPQAALFFVACVNDTNEARQCLLRSPCFQGDGAWPLLLAHQQSSAAQGLDWALSVHPHGWIVQLHQDVFLPAGWPERFAARLAQAHAEDPLLAVAGVYGVDAQGHHRGHVWDRDRWLGSPFEDAPAVRSIDELLLAVRADAALHHGLRPNPDLGWHLYGTDLALRAMDVGYTARVLSAPCEHHSSLPREGEALTQAAFDRSAAVLRRRWAQALPVHTCVATISGVQPS
jgi:hypothetical protein